MVSRRVSDDFCLEEGEREGVKRNRTRKLGKGIVLMIWKKAGNGNIAQNFEDLIWKQERIARMKHKYSLKEVQKFGFRRKFGTDLDGGEHT